MTPSWKDISKSIAFILLFGVIGYNLYLGSGILVSIFRGLLVFVVFMILEVILTNVVTRLLNDYEIRRLQELQEEEETEREEEEKEEETSVEDKGSAE